MKLAAKQLETIATGTRRITGRTGFFRGAFTVLGIFALFAATTSARAACGDPGRSADHVTLPPLSQGAPASDSIVGLWHVIYSLSPTVVFNESFDTWHSDGTEFDNAYLPPSANSVCEGVWKQIGPRTVRLHHVGWTFSPDGITLTGTFALDETSTLAPNGKTYSGTFTFKTYNKDGSFTGNQVDGTIAATRITVD
jgi:hypothetical protein